MSWPEADITIDETTLTIRLAGLTTTQPAHTLDAARHAARAYLASWAAHLGRPIAAHVTDPDGAWSIAVGPDGDTTDAAPAKRK